MSASAEFQTAILQALLADSGVAAIVGVRVYDGAPADPVYPYVVFGPSDFVLDDPDCLTDRNETLQIDCWTSASGRLWPCRALVDAVVKALHNAELSLPDPYALRRTYLERAQVMPDVDRKKAHGVVVITGEIEEPDT